MRDLLSRLALSIALLVVAAVIGGVALGFLFAALYIILAGVVDAGIAALLTGLAAAVVAMVFVVVARAIVRPSHPAAGERGASTPSAAIAADVGRALGDGVSALSRSHAKSLTIAALCAGFAVGVSPRLRRALWRLLDDERPRRGR